MEEAIVRDVVHDKADLIAVTCEHDARPAFCVAGAEDVAHHVRADVVAPGFDPLAHELLHVVLVAGWTRRLDELLEEIFAVLVHVRTGILAPLDDQCNRQWRATRFAAVDRETADGWLIGRDNAVEIKQVLA